LRLGALLAIIAIVTSYIGTARADGAEIFGARCALCHQSDARGLPGIYPPLADSVGAYVAVRQGRKYLVEIVLNGMSGPIDAKGTTYNGLMTPFASLSDDEIAATLNYLLNKYNSGMLPKEFEPITPDEVRHARSAHPSATDLARERKLIRESIVEENRKGVAKETVR
jgi:mono/diheme cytochrome c family protein